MANEITIKVKGDTREAEQSLTGLQKHVKRVGDGVRMAAKGFNIMAAAGAAAGAVVFTFARAGDEIQKMALRTGFSTEALSELRFAAEQSGTSIAGMETGIKRMSRVINDAERELSTAVDALAALSFTAKDFVGLSPEEAFTKLSMAVADLEDPLKQAAISQEVFGRAGTQLLPMLSQGAEGIALLRQEARDLGIVFDQEMANKAAEVTDAMNSAKQSILTLAYDFGATVSPAITDMAEKFSDLDKNIRATAVAVGILATAIKVGLVPKQLMAPLAVVGSVWLTLKVAADKVKTSMTQLITENMALAVQFESGMVLAREHAASLQGLKFQLLDTVSAANLMEKAINRAAGAMVDAAHGTGVAAAELAESTEEIALSNQNAVFWANRMASSFRSLTDDININSAAVDTGAKKYYEMVDAFKEIHVPTEAWRTKLIELTNITGDADLSMRIMGDRMKDHLMESVDVIAEGYEGVADAIKSYEIAGVSAVGILQLLAQGHFGARKEVEAMTDAINNQTAAQNGLNAALASDPRGGRHREFADMPMIGFPLGRDLSAGDLTRRREIIANIRETGTFDGDAGDAANNELQGRS